MLANPGCLHIIYNALESSCKSNVLDKGFVDSLKVLSDFITDLSLVRKFKAECCTEAEAKTFTRQATVHIDWKWEFLSRALDHLAPAYPLIKKRFDVQKMLYSDSGQKLTNQTIKNTGDVMLQITSSQLLRCIGCLASQSRPRPTRWKHVIVI